MMMRTHIDQNDNRWRLYLCNHTSPITGLTHAARLSLDGDTTDSLIQKDYLQIVIMK